MFKYWKTWISVRWGKSQYWKVCYLLTGKKAHSKVTSRLWVIVCSNKKIQIQVSFWKYFNKASAFSPIYIFPSASSCSCGIFPLKIFFLWASQAASAVKDRCQGRRNSAVSIAWQAAFKLNLVEQFSVRRFHVAEGTTNVRQNFPKQSLEGKVSPGP